MKRLLTGLMLLVALQLSAQSKELLNAQKQLERATNRVENPKHAARPKSWTTLADAYTNLYEIPLKSIWIGASEMEVKMMLKDDKVIGSEAANVAGIPFQLEKYEDKILYYSNTGELAAWRVTGSENQKTLLQKAFDALKKASEVDSKGAISKDITAKLENLRIKNYNEAMSAHTLGDYSEASIFFERTVEIGEHPLLANIDTAFLYYAGLTAFMDRNFDRAIKFFNRSIELDYDSDGDAYSYLAESYKATNQLDLAKDILNQGFTKHPGAQSILVSLINAYLESNDDPNKILELIAQAQANEPQNATLHYAEGNVLKNLGEFEKAIEAYTRSTKIDPTYFYGHFAVGAAYYDKAVEIQTKATEELDDAKYMALVGELEGYLMKARSPFEKCFAATNEKEIRLAVAEYLKNIYFRFREKEENYKRLYEKYDEYLKKNSDD